jgi:hypothetical protein
MSALAAPTFSERLRKRYALWWAPPPPWWTLRGARLQLYRRGLSRLHRADEMQVLRHRADPDRVWRFCRYWQRTLLNKFNSREFVQRYDCRVPTLYWCGRRIVDLPVESLSDSYVIRPVIGAASKRVYAVIGDHDLMSETTVTRANLRDRLVSEFGEVAAEPILVEEFVHSPGRSSELPREYKIHVFGDRIAAITVQERALRKPTLRQEVDAEWKRFPRALDPRATPGDTVEPPACLDEMLTSARRLATAFGTYVRVDFYATEAGPVFGEFSSTPGGGRHVTPFGDDYLGRLWNEVYPREV